MSFRVWALAASRSSATRTATDTVGGGNNGTVSITPTSVPGDTLAIQVVDAQAGIVVEEAKKQGYVTLITADHGNCEQMIDPQSGHPHTALPASSRTTSWSEKASTLSPTV